MSEPFYQSVWRREELVVEAKWWVGTPFRKGASVRGAGVDCVHLVVALWQASGFCPGIEMPRHYSLDEGAHASASRVITLADGCRLLEAVWRFPGSTATLMTGDLLVFAPDSQSAHHVGILLNHPAEEFQQPWEQRDRSVRTLDRLGDSRRGAFLHAWRETGVVVGELEDATFKQMLVAVYRPLASPRGDA